MDVYIKEEFKEDNITNNAIKILSSLYLEIKDYDYGMPVNGKIKNVSGEEYDKNYKYLSS